MYKVLFFVRNKNVNLLFYMLNFEAGQRKTICAMTREGIGSYLWGEVIV